MTDQEVMTHITELVDEEHRLFQQAERTGLDETQKGRLDTLQVALDQCWDLLRQRRAKREFGKDPDQVHLRSASVVEHFKQ